MLYLLCGQGSAAEVRAPRLKAVSVSQGGGIHPTEGGGLEAAR